MGFKRKAVAKYDSGLVGINQAMATSSFLCRLYGVARTSPSSSSFLTVLSRHIVDVYGDKAGHGNRSCSSDTKAEGNDHISQAIRDKGTITLIYAIYTFLVCFWPYEIYVNCFFSCQDTHTTTPPEIPVLLCSIACFSRY
jgi:hypothetical protein